MNQQVQTLVSNILTEEHLEAEQTFNSIIMEKVSAKLDEMKHNVMANILEANWAPVYFGGKEVGKHNPKSNTYIPGQHGIAAGHKAQKGLPKGVSMANTNTPDANNSHKMSHPHSGDIEESTDINVMGEFGGLIESKTQDKIDAHNKQVSRYKSYNNINFNHPSILKTAPRGFYFDMSHQLVKK